MTAVKFPLGELDFWPKCRQNDTTQWTDLLPELPGNPSYLTRKMGTTVDEDEERLRRACGALSLIKTKFQCKTNTPEEHPLQWGALATNGIESYEQLLHATSAGIQHTRAIAAAKTDIKAAKQHAGKALAHFNKAGEWIYDRALCPPLLQPHQKKKTELLINVLWAAGRPQPEVSPEPERAATIGILQATLKHSQMPNCPRLRAELSKTLADHAFVGWSRQKKDPRPTTIAGAAGDDVNDERALAAMKMVEQCPMSFHKDKKPPPEDVVRFYTVHNDVYKAHELRKHQMAFQSAGGVLELRDAGVVERYCAVARMPAAPIAELPVVHPAVLGYT